MRIALCSPYVPFVRSGTRTVIAALQAVLREAGHQAETVYLPHVDTPQHAMQQMAAFRWLELQETAERIICFAPPAHVIRHQAKVLWFLHAWDQGRPGAPAERHDNEHQRGLSEAARRADSTALREARLIFTNSRRIAGDLKQRNDVDATLLHPPLHRPDRFQSRGFNDEVLCVTSVQPQKRQHLLVRALGHAKTPVRLRLCGAPLSSSYADQLRAEIADAGLQERIAFESEWISEVRKAELLADCLAAAHVPLAEDWHGYFALESSRAGKPMLTTRDAGGVLDLVEDGRNGIVAEPTPEALGAALDHLYQDRAETRRMGSEARLKVEELGNDWAAVVGALLQ